MNRHALWSTAACIAAFFACSPAWAQINKCVDARGKVSYQEQPCPGAKIERIVPRKLLAFRWHPGADPEVGPDAPTTLVTFELEEVAGGTRLTITESGFDALPLERRAKAFADNEGGWEAQLGLVAKYLALQV